MPSKKTSAQPFRNTPLVRVEAAQLLRCRTPLASSGLADQTQLATSGARLLGDGRVDRKLSNALGRPKDDPNPSQVVGHGGGSGTGSATAPNMIDEDGGGEQERVALADRVVLQKLQVGLLASLPLGDRLELIDVPPNELAQARRPVLDSDESCRILQGYLAGLRPLLCRCTVLKRLGFAVDDHALPLDADVGRIASRTR